MCIAVAAAGLNLLTGYNGQISVGHGALYGLGAYTAAILVTDAGWPMLRDGLRSRGGGVLRGRVSPSACLRCASRVCTWRWSPCRWRCCSPPSSSSSPGSPGRIADCRWWSPRPNCPRGRPECPASWESPFGGLASDQWRYFIFLAITVLMFIADRQHRAFPHGSQPCRHPRQRDRRRVVGNQRVAGEDPHLRGVGGHRGGRRSDARPQQRSCEPHLVHACSCRSTCWSRLSSAVRPPIIGPAIGAIVYRVFADVVAPSCRDGSRTPRRSSSACC